MASDKFLYLNIRAERCLVDGRAQYGHGELTAEEATALGLLLKRLVFPDYRRNARDDAEAYLMGAAMGKLRHMLADAGIVQGVVLEHRKLGPSWRLPSVPGQTGDLFQDLT